MGLGGIVKGKATKLRERIPKGTAVKKKTESAKS